MPIITDMIAYSQQAQKQNKTKQKNSMKKNMNNLQLS